MRVKICGLTRAEDAALAQSLGAWALGFIFYSQSKRHIDAGQAEAIIRALPKPALAIGVFVNQTDDVPAIAKQAGLGGVQLHGDETPEDCKKIKQNFSGLVIKAFRPKTENDLAAIPAYKGIVDYILLDAAVAGEFGGTGKTTDWALAAKAATLCIPLILAGGLTAENILAANRQVHPFALDLSSGVEISPGIKDTGKLKGLFKAIQGDKS
ncbi:MAG: phosphoribosylanthranilate isomerase [Alphaproteobacteria bacterium]|nr:phosphoribosylanthranilate isomerase [Alphaproteobacteria bacterium]